MPTSTYESQKQRNAVTRRKAFQQFMSRKDLNPAEWARMAGLPNANAIYNFIAGRSSSLSQETLQRLADAIPNVVVSDIFGETQAKRPGTPTADRSLLRRVRVKSVAKANLWRRMYDIPSADQREIIVSAEEIEIDEAIRIEDDSCDQMFPRGSFALIHRIENGADAKIGDAVAVMCVRNRGAGVVETEVTIRKLIESNGEVVVAWQSHNPHLKERIPVIIPNKGDVFTNPGEPDTKTTKIRYQLVGVVMMVQVPARASLTS